VTIGDLVCFSMTLDMKRFEDIQIKLSDQDDAGENHFYFGFSGDIYVRSTLSRVPTFLRDQLLEILSPRSSRRHAAVIKSIRRHTGGKLAISPLDNSN
jgi:hypothetical protein